MKATDYIITAHATTRPLLGRFISEDPAEDGLNFYAYADDDPINFSDPFGLSPQAAGAAAQTAARAARTGFQVIEGGKNAAAFLPRGAGPWALAGFLAAFDGFVAYEDYDAIRAFNAENAAYADYMKAVHNLNIVLLSRAKQPGAPTLGGRYSAQRKQAEHDAYKEVCQAEAPTHADPCATLASQIDHTNRCVKMMQAWDAKWPDPSWPAGRHVIDIKGLLNRLKNLKDEHDSKCTQ